MGVALVVTVQATADGIDGYRAGWVLVAVCGVIAALVSLAQPRSFEVLSVQVVRCPRLSSSSTPTASGRRRVTSGSLQGVHGGYVAALAVTAAERVLAAEGVEPGTTMRAATFGYVSGNRLGEL